MKNCNTRFTGVISSGFTLIELIVVIVILGILAVSAAPRFINLQSDARAATLNAMMGAVKSANSLILGKAVIHGVNTKYSEKEAGGTGNWTDDCSVDNCVNIGQMWVYLKYAYIDRNSVAFIIDADISGKSTRPLSNGKTVPARDNGKGNVQYPCLDARDAVCEDYDFCQCRIPVGRNIGPEKGRDSQVIVPRGFKYDITQHTGRGCYFKYTSAEYDKNTKKPQPPMYRVETGGC